MNGPIVCWVFGVNWVNTLSGKLISETRTGSRCFLLLPATGTDWYMCGARFGVWTETWDTPLQVCWFKMMHNKDIISEKNFKKWYTSSSLTGYHSKWYMYPTFFQEKSFSCVEIKWRHVLFFPGQRFCQLLTNWRWCWAISEISMPTFSANTPS